MPEGRETIDWASAFKQLGSQVQGAFDVRKNERAAFDEQALATSEEISHFEAGQNQTYNELVFNAADSGRNQIAEWNAAAKRGEITQADLKYKMNNLSSGMTGFAKSAKDFDLRNVEMLSRIEQGKSGALEIYLNQNFAELADLKNQEYYTDPSTGKGSIIKRDENGDIISKQDSNRVNNPGNMIGVKVNLAEDIDSTVKLWEPYAIEQALGRGKSITTTSMDQVPGFAESIVSLKASILSDDRSILSVLADNSEAQYDMWQTEKEKEKKIGYRRELAKEVARMKGEDFDEDEFMKLTNDQLVQIKQDATGILQPVITDNMRKRAGEVVENAINMQLKKTVSVKTGFAPTQGRAPRDPKDPEYPDTYNAIQDAWKSKSNGAMNAIIKDNYKAIYDKNGDKFNIYKMDYSLEEPKTFVTSARSPEQLANYIYKPGTNTTATELYKEEERLAKGGSTELSAEDLINKYK
ncbi:MAG TPA: hypothetical protein VMV86_03200 [Methanosarcinales archaeon]|nr:hypothetical protein [Methanosarcinales archaeon]